MTPRRWLFVATHGRSSGEAVTARHAALDLRRAGGEVWFAASPRATAVLEGAGPVVTLAGDRTANRAQLDRLLAEVDPDAVVFADHAILGEAAGGVPLVDETWPAMLDALAATLVTFDHLGLEQAAGPYRPSRLRVMRPCPLHDPAPHPGRRGRPYRAYPALAADPEAAGRARAAWCPEPGRRLIVHAVAPWAAEMARTAGNPFYRWLPHLLDAYLGSAAAGVTLVSINDGALLPTDDVALRVINLPPQPVAAFEALIAAADLFITENGFSTSLAKAAQAGVPAIAWQNRHDLPSLLASLARETPAGVLAAVLAAPEMVTPWRVFPAWSFDLARTFTVLDDNPFADTFVRIEIFGGEETRVAVGRVLGEPAAAAALRAAREAYTARLADLQGPAQALEAELAAAAGGQPT